MEHMIEQCMTMMPMMSTMMWPMMVSQFLVVALLMVGLVLLLRSLIRLTPRAR
jgi:hypothetical protein